MCGSACLQHYNTDGLSVGNKIFLPLSYDTYDDIFFFFFFSFGATAPQRARASSFMRFLDHTRRTTVSSTPLDERSARRTDLFLTVHNNHNRQTSMPPVGFEPTISVGGRQQTYALDGVATETSTYDITL